MHINLPSNSDIEINLLSIAMNSETAANVVLSETFADDYYLPKHQLLFSTLKTLHLNKQPLDMVFIVNELKIKNKLNELSITDLMQIANIAPISLDWESYIEQLKNLSFLRKFIHSAQDAVLQAAKPGTNKDTLLDQFQQKLIMAQGSEKVNSQSIKECLDDFHEGMNFNQHLDWMISKKLQGKPLYQGVSSGFPILDETLGYFRNGCLYFVGARTSMGKTTFLLNLMNKMRDRKVGFFSLEMPARIISAKLLCIAADVRFSAYEDVTLFPERVERLHEMSKYYKNAHLYIEDSSFISINMLKARAKRMKLLYGIEILFIDYLTLIKGSIKNNKHLEIDEVSKSLQSLAKELNIPIVCLAQLNRQSAKDSAKEGSKPTLTDFRESGSIEEDADACLLIHRPSYYDPMNKPGVIEVIVAKNRLRGMLKTINFSCNSIESDRYYELPSIEDIKNDAKQSQFREAQTFIRDLCHPISDVEE